MTFANIELILFFFSKFIALPDVSVLLILKHGNTFITKRAVNDIETSIQSTNGIYRPISFLLRVPAIDLSSASIFLSCGKILRRRDALWRFLKCFLFFLFLRTFRKWRLSSVTIVRSISILLHSRKVSINVVSRVESRVYNAQRWQVDVERVTTS